MPDGDRKLEAVVISGAGPDSRVETSALFAMIGAAPRSEALVVRSIHSSLASGQAS